MAGCRSNANEPLLQRQRLLLIGACNVCRAWAADETQPGTGPIHAGAEESAPGERGDIIRTMRRRQSGRRELAVFEPGQDADDGRSIVGRVAARGWSTSCTTGLSGDRRRGRQGPLRCTQRQRRVGELSHRAVVEVRGSAEVLAADKNIAAGERWPVPHRPSPAIEQRPSKAGRDPQEVVAAHVRRLEACGGLASSSAWPMDSGRCRTAERGRRTTRSGWRCRRGDDSPLSGRPVIGATWLDQQLIGGGKGLGDWALAARSRTPATARRLPRRTGLRPSGAAAG